MRLSTAEKVNAGFLVALSIVAVIAVASIASIRVFLATSQEVRRTHGVLTELQSMLADLASAESAQRGFVITGDETYIEPYESARQRVITRLERLRQETFADDAQLRRLEELAGTASNRLQLMNDIVDQRRSRGFESSAELVASGGGRDLMAVIRTVAAEFEAAELARLEAADQRAALRARLATAVIAAGGLFTFLIVSGAAFAIKRDYTERRRAEQALRDSETLLSQFMENLPIGVLVIDFDGQPRFANNAAAEILGPHVLVDTGAAPLPLFRAGDHTPYPQELTPVYRALRGEIASVDDAEVAAATGTVPVEVSAAPVYDASGRIAYAITTFSDVTDRRRSAEALRSAKEAAETASRTKSDFLARMSHELRTPLNSVIGFANILLKNRTGNLLPTDVTYLERILENGKHLLLLINDILDLSKIEAGKVEVSMEPVDLAELVAGVTQQWDGQLAAGQVTMHTDIPATVERLPTDPARLRQVLVNLVGNAVKFTERGEIVVQVELMSGSARAHAIHVRDTGIGIHEDRLEAIFDAFEQAESSTARKYGGTGLGLPISRALCELLGYRLSVRSRPGEGTQFSIYLLPEPPGELAALAGSQQATGPTADDDRHTVLIVDDEEDSRVLLTHYVEEFGCRAVSAQSAAQALRLARELAPRLITLDLMMPDVNGWDLLSQLKADPQLAGIPVVVVSIIAQESRASVLGAIDLLQKPVDRGTLFTVLRRNVASAKPRVLIIEDDDDARELMRQMVTESAGDIRTASDGRAALDVLHEFEPDLVITDLLMPGMDGMTFLEVFRATPRYQHVPVVVVTARDLTGADLDRLARHTSAVLEKGNFLEDDLRRTLGSILMHDHATSTAGTPSSHDARQRGG